MIENNIIKKNKHFAKYKNINIKNKKTFNLKKDN